MGEFYDELKSLLNRYCKENESDTPDFLLAEYLDNCLDNYNYIVRQREVWYGRKPKVYSNLSLKIKEIYEK